METSPIHENKENVGTAGLEEVINDLHSHESAEENNEDNAPTPSPLPISDNAPMSPVSNNSPTTPMPPVSNDVPSPPMPVSNNAPMPPVSTPRENYLLNQQQKAPIYLMVDPSIIPNTKGQHIQLFNLHDGVRQIVGYCLPLKYCVELFKYIQPARVIKLTEINNSQFHEQISTKFKFNSTPLCVAPMNEKEYQEMMKSPPVPLPSRNWPSMRNRFFVRQFSPNSQKGVFSPNSSRGLQFFDDSAMNFVMEKFKLHTNPHLIPFRLHDGLDCFIRLDLASHCQQGSEIIDCNLLRSPTMPYHQYTIFDKHHSEELESAIRKNNGNGRERQPQRKQLKSPSSQ